MYAAYEIHELQYTIILSFKYCGIHTAPMPYAFSVLLFINNNNAALYKPQCQAEHST